MKGCASYLRYSSDRQSPSSIHDQLRNCREYAHRHGWMFLEDHIYSDEALSGAGADRPGLCKLLEAALSRSRPFDIVLVDDTSRLSRNLGDTVRVYEKLSFAGIRIVAVSQGIDTQNEQADVLVTIHGLVDSLYIKELGKKTHRGLEGLALRGLHTGGRCFGYINEQHPEGVRLKINPAEAEVVRRIFTMAASGYSLKAIAKTLNAERIAPPRPRAGKQYGTWCPTAIRAMLRRELYLGKVIWNQSRFVKAPGSNKRLRRPRPQSEWRIVEKPELRIIEDTLSQEVKERLALVKQAHGMQCRDGLLNRAASSGYLLSGFLKCGHCGANLVIVTGRGRRRHPKYGCSQNFYRGTCSNSLKEPQLWLEQRLLGQLQSAVLQPAAVEYAVEEFGQQLRAALANHTSNLASLLERQKDLKAELQRLVAAIADGGHSTFLLNAIAERERELSEAEEKALSMDAKPAEVRQAEIRAFVTSRLTDIRGLLSTDVSRARAELGKHVKEIRMLPQEDHYVAAGEWDLLGGYLEKPTLAGLTGVRERMVAGGGFEPPTFGL